MTRPLLLLLAAATACAPAVGGRAGGGLTPEQALARATGEFRRGDFDKALADYQRLTFDLPAAHPANAEVHYFLAECYFQTGNMVEAAHAFRAVADQYPESPYAPVALLRAGDANFRSWRRPELDPSYGEAALAIYQELQGRYPQSDAAARSQLHVRALREQMAAKEYQNGMFYYRRRAFDSGIIYFKDVIATYGETSWAVESLLRLIDSYRVIGYTDELRETCDNLRRFHPDAVARAPDCAVDTTAAAR